MIAGELRMVRAALPTAAACAVSGALVAWAIRGSDGAISVVLAAGVILGNAICSAGLSALAGKFAPTGPALIALPSFAVRMAGIFAVLGMLRSRPFIDIPTFAIAFGAMLALTLFLEARAYKRTPWIALTFGPKEQQ